MNRQIARWGAVLVSGSALTFGITAAQARVIGTAPARPAAVSAHAAVAGWRVYRTVSIPGQVVFLGGIAAVSADDAWVAGEHGPALTPLVERWDGSRWHRVALPAAVTAHLAGQSPAGTVGASPGRDLWIAGPAGRYAHLLGTHWTTGTLPQARPGHLFIGTIRVFGPRQAWAFGTTVTSTSPQLRLAPYAAHFDGTRWRATAVPGHGLLAASAASARDIWAISGAFTRAPKVLRWNGSSWQAPQAQPPLPGHATLDDILALSGHDVWVGGCAPNARGGTSEIALHWNGTSWTSASPPAAPSPRYRCLTNLVPDGAGGLWGTGEQLPGAPRFWHYTAGAWSAPVTGSPRWVLLHLAWVPGTRSIWATTARGLIVLHGPVPR